MGSLPVVSILRGPTKPINVGTEPILIHKIIENTVRTLESNNNDEKIETIHSINLTDFTAQNNAIIDHTGERLNYSELNEAANKLARSILNYLKKGGKKIKPNSDGDYVVAVAFNPSKACVITLLAIWKIGAAYLPIDHAFPVQRVRHILNESEPILIIADFIDGQKFENKNAITYTELKASSLKLANTNIPTADTLSKDIPEDSKIGIILYTSGSTGTSKGVRILHKSMLNRLKWQWKHFPYEPFEKVCVFKTAYTFVDSFTEIWGPLCCGRSVFVVSKEDTKNPEKLIELVEQFKVYRMVVVPSLLNSILVYVDMTTIGSSTGSIKTHTNRLPDLRLWVSSGETLSSSVADKFFSVMDKCHLLCNFYGSTEVMGDVTYHILDPDQVGKEERIPIGKPVDNCNVYLLSAEMKPVQANEVGEMYVSGANLSAGYVRNRDPHRFIDNPFTVDPNHSKLYKTGDYARMIKNENNENVLIFEGRTDSQIKIRGHRVDLSEVEAAIAKIPEIDKFAVLTYKPGEIDQALLAYIQLKPGRTITDKAIENKLHSSLTFYMIPRVIIINRMPLLVNGKVDRQALLQKYEGEYCPKAVFLQKIDYFGLPKSVKERAKVLFETIALCLGPNLKGRITASANFFTIGGNSLNSVFTVAKLRDLGYVIGVDKFIRAKNLLEIASKMTKDSPEIDIAEITNILETKYKLEIITDQHKEDAYEIISKSFLEKADLELWLNPEATYENYRELMDLFWPSVIRQKLSFAVRAADGSVKAVALNFDASDEPALDLDRDNPLTCVFEFLDYYELPAKKKHSLPEGRGKLLHSCMAGVKLGTPPDEAVELFFYMETELLKLGREMGFAGVFSTNTNPLTQQLALDVHNYQMLEEIQVNQWKDTKGVRPFHRAPDDQKIFVCYKAVD